MSLPTFLGSGKHTATRDVFFMSAFYLITHICHNLPGQEILGYYAKTENFIIFTPCLFSNTNILSDPIKFPNEQLLLTNFILKLSTALNKSHEVRISRNSTRCVIPRRPMFRTSGEMFSSACCYLSHILGIV